VVQRYAYSSFGKIESQLTPNFLQPYTYTARELDAETGLYYYRARYYDATVGRFLQTDPIGIAGGPNLYIYSSNDPINQFDPFGLDSIDDLANFTAGFGDVVSLGLTDYLRGKIGINDVVDKCSTSYSVGWWAGMLHQLAFSGAGSFSGGARTVLYHGDGALEAARAAKGAGRLLEDTLGGKLLNFVDQRYQIPDSVWKPVSRIFSANAKGDVRVFLRNSEIGGIWNAVERPTLNFINTIHSAVMGSPATRTIMM